MVFCLKVFLPPCSIFLAHTLTTVCGLSLFKEHFSFGIFLFFPSGISCGRKDDICISRRYLRTAYGFGAELFSLSSARERITKKNIIAVAGRAQLC